METSELLKKVRKIEIKTKGLSKHIFSGEYHSAFKGRGMSFSEVRDYQYGDDVRNIDWNVTARTGDPHVKVFEEERELTVMILVDVSQSSFFGRLSACDSVYQCFSFLDSVCKILILNDVDGIDGLKERLITLLKLDDEIYTDHMKFRAKMFVLLLFH